MSIELSPQDKADLAAVRQAFIGSMQGLTEEQRIARAKVLARGVRETDPYTRALAQQVVDARAAHADIINAQAELEAIERNLRKGGYRPGNPSWQGDALVRQEEWKQQIEQAHARTIALAEDTHETAQRKAAVHFRQVRAEASRAEAVKEAVARMEAKIDAEEVERRAERIVRSRRTASGRDSSGRTAGESQ